MVLKYSQSCEIGLKPEQFYLLGVDEQVYSLDYLKGAPASLIIFMCNHCPYVKSLMGRLMRETALLTEAGVKILAINSNDTITYPEDSFGKMKEFAALHEMTFPYLIDVSQSVADRFKVECTPEFFGYNANMELQYHGRLDDGTTDNPEVTSRDLTDAMRMILDTGKGPKEQIPSMGCSIKRYQDN